jgi:hypothetical protein
MPWKGYPETMVTHITFTEWVFSLRAQREVQIGYSIRVNDWWELFGNERWVWFTGAVASFMGVIQIVSQWAERENLGPRDRVWHWVHWKNPANVDVIVQPYLLLSPPSGGNELMQAREVTARRSIWTVADAVTRDIVAAGTAVPGPGGGSGGGGGGGGGGRGGRDSGGLQLTVVPRPLEDQRLSRVELKGDLRHLPIEDLWGRLDRLVPAPAREAPAGRHRRRPAASGARRNRRRP